MQEGTKNHISAKDCFEKIKNPNPKQKRFDNICRKYGDDCSQDNELIREFTHTLHLYLKARKSISKAGNRTDIFVQFCELKYERLVDATRQIEQEFTMGERAYFIENLNDRSLHDLLRPSKNEMAERKNLDGLNRKLQRNEQQIDVLGRQIETFREWVQTSEHKRFIDDYNYLSNRICRENKQALMPSMH